MQQTHSRPAHGSRLPRPLPVLSTGKFHLANARRNRRYPADPLCDESRIQKKSNMETNGGGMRDTSVNA
jgi:hypothetical protein